MHKLTLHQIARHRNGRTGEPFYAVVFEDPKVNRTFLATIFAASFDRDTEAMSATHDVDGNYVNPKIAVVAIDQLPDVTFGENSWAGDLYVDELVDAINRRYASPPAERQLICGK